MSLPTHTEVIDDITFFDDWEQRYQYIIDLGKHLPPYDDEYRTAEYTVKGCQSTVWIKAEFVDGRINILADSDAIIVRGLIAIVLAIYNNKTPQEVSDLDINEYFASLDLERHITPTRGNGLRSIVSKVENLATGYL